MRAPDEQRVTVRFTDPETGEDRAESALLDEEGVWALVDVMEEHDRGPALEAGDEGRAT